MTMIEVSKFAGKQYSFKWKEIISQGILLVELIWLAIYQILSWLGLMLLFIKHSGQQLAGKVGWVNLRYQFVNGSRIMHT